MGSQEMTASCGRQGGVTSPAQATSATSISAGLERQATPVSISRAWADKGRHSRVAALLVAVLLSAVLGGSRAAGAAGLLDLDRFATARLGPGPAGWISYCLAQPAYCLHASPPARVPWSGAVAGLVARVQREVNAAIEPAAEPASRDLWVVAPLAGDCEDFALTKREALRAAGLPAGALRLATAYTEAGEYHTVLTVQTERGTLVLDNRFAEVRPLANLPYRWVMVELPDRPFAWAYL